MTNVLKFPTLRQLTPEEETIRQARLRLQECWAVRAESRAIQRRYQERQARIDALLERIGA